MNASLIRCQQKLINGSFCSTTAHLRSTFVRISLIGLLPWWLSSCANLADHPSPLPQRIEQVEQSLAANIRTSNDKDWTIQERMKYYKVPGLSIAVIHNHQIDWAKAYGWADVGQQKPATAETRFLAGSVSKSINGMGVLTLVQDGKVDLHIDINQYLTSWQFPYDAVSKGKTITTANLLSHTAGLSVDGFPGYAMGEPVPSLPQILDGQYPANTPAVRSQFEPGLKYQYSGGGTTISQLLLSDVTRQPYEQYMWERVLKPLGMLSSSFQQPPLEDGLLATGYDYEAKELPGKYHVYPEKAAAGLWTTPSDLCRYIIETQLAYAGKSAKVLSSQTASLYLTPYIDQSAALGVFIDKRASEAYFFHNGADAGFRALYYGSLTTGDGVVVMINSENADILTEVANSVARVYNWEGFYQPVTKPTITLPATSLDAYVGDYRAGEFLGQKDVIFSVEREGDQLFQVMKGFFRWSIFPQTETRFILTSYDAQIDFVKDNTGRVTGQVFTFAGQKSEALKIK